MSKDTKLTTENLKDVEGNIENSERRSSLRSSTPNFVQRNIVQASKTKKIQYDYDEANALPSTSESRRFSNSSSRIRKNSSDAETLPSRLETIESNVASTSSGEMKEIFKNVDDAIKFMVDSSVILVQNADNSILDYSHTHKHQDHQHVHGVSFSEDILKEHQELDENEKFKLKDTTCPACLENWKKTSPTPKTNMLQLTERKDYLKTDSKQRMEFLLYQEEQVLESYNTKFPLQKRQKTPVLKKGTTEQPKSKSSDPKVEHEMRVEHTRKKVEKFLDTL